MAFPTGHVGGDETIVTIDFTALHAGFDFNTPNRRILLSESQPVIRVGRASKVPSKGFVAAPNNAWFESPVMSREHAEITANFQDQTVSLKDIGSLHGTFRRSRDSFETEERLANQESIQVRNGDRVRFGTDIYRSKQTFPPCTLDVMMYWEKSPNATLDNKASSINTFVVPDDEDEDEDDDGNYLSDDSSILEYSSSSVQYVDDLEETMALKDRRGSMPHVIDLTSDTGTKSESCVILDDEHNDSDDYSPSPSAHLVSQGALDLAEDQASQSEDGDSHSEGSIDYNSSEDDSIDEDGDVPGDESDRDELSQADDDEFSYPQEELTSESEDELMDASLFESRPGPRTSHSPPSTSPVATIVTDGRQTKESTSIVMDRMAVPEKSLPADTVSFMDMDISAGSHFDASSSPSAASNWRQSSLFDPALAKRQNIPLPITSLLNPASTAQALGHRTGKHDYFAARAHNRATILANPHIIVIGEEGEASHGNRDESRNCTTETSLNASRDEKQSAAQISVDGTWTEPPHAPNDVLIKSAWTASGEAFLQEPQALSEERTRLQSPELDMTSAASFMESKINATSVGMSASRRLAIPDLLAHESKESSPNPRGPRQPSASPRPPKRTYDEVFDEEWFSAPADTLDPQPAITSPMVFPDELVFTPLTATIPSPPKVNRPAVTHSQNPLEGEIEQGLAKHSSQDEHGLSEQINDRTTLSTLVRVSDVRQTKRRRLHKVAACAISTVVGGAAVLAGLIATAPAL